MNTIDDQKRKDAIKGLINIAILEGFALVLVVGIYLNTSNIAHLIGGIIGVSLFSAPVMIRWAKAHGAAMRANPNTDHKPN